MDTITEDTGLIQHKESRREAFIRLGNKRLDNTCQFIDLLENLLKNRNAYEYYDADVELIIKKLHNKIERLKKYWHVSPVESGRLPN